VIVQIVRMIAWLFPASAWARDSASVDFSRDVLPILSQNCFLCHGPDAKSRKADLRLDSKQSALRTKEPISVPGKSAESELIRRIFSTDPDEAMPPPKAGRKLSAIQKQMLRRWVDQGARWVSTGPSSRRVAFRRPRCTMRAGHETRSIVSFWPGSNPRNESRRSRPIAPP
jgi:hypothetical protein